MTDRILTLLGKWRWPLAVAGTFLLAAGFDFRTPSSQFNELRAQDHVLFGADSGLMDSLNAHRRESKRDSDIIRSLGIYRCLHSTAAEQQMLRLPCPDLLSGR
jgi:hypothetical protein